MDVHPLYPLPRVVVQTAYVVANHPRALRTLHGLLHAHARHHDTLTDTPVAPPLDGYRLVAADLARA